MRYYILIFALLITSSYSFAQINCGTIISESEIAFGPSEELNYTVTYNSAVVNTAIADVKMTTQALHWGAIPCYKVTAKAATRPFYNVFFKIDNSYESVMDRSRLRPLVYNSTQREGGYRYNTSYAYNWNTKTVKTTGHNVKREKTYTRTLKLKQCSYDAISLFYNMRCMKGDNIGPGYRLNLDLVLEDTIRTISFRFVKREIYTIKGIGKFRTMKFAGQLATQTGESFDDGSEFLIWISDDKNRIPIFVESPIKVGRIRGSISSWRGLKHPFTSLVVEPSSSTGPK